MIEGKCYTNVDDFRFKKWPEIFVAVPKKGSYIESKDGTRAIVQTITHCLKIIKGADGSSFSRREVPFIKIYINKEYRGGRSLGPGMP
jgi:hypothetical protein